MTSRRYRSSKQVGLRLIRIILFALVLVSLRWWTTHRSESPPSESGTSGPISTSSPEGATAIVKRVVDGDTLLLESGERVRLLGVDTPETKKPNTPIQPYGPEASEFTRRMVEGKTVQLVFDRERFDKYGRTLAFVYLGEICLNEELILQGLSPAQLQYPYRNDMKRRFRNAEETARSAHLGIWSLPEHADSAR